MGSAAYLSNQRWGTPWTGCTHTDNLESPINQTPLSAYLWTVGEDKECKNSTQMMDLNPGPSYYEETVLTIQFKCFMVIIFTMMNSVFFPPTVTHIRSTGI